MTKNAGQATADLRAVTLHMLALQLLEAARDAGSDAGILSVAFDEHGKLTVKTDDDPDADTNERRRGLIATLTKACDALMDSQDGVLRIASDMDALREWLPSTIDDALRQVAITQERYAAAATDYVDRLAEWGAVDSLTGRTRQQCVKELMAGGMAATPADKAASDHPVYTAHKDTVLELAHAKDEADVARDIARIRAMNARSTLDAMLAHPQLFGRHRAALELVQGGASKPVPVVMPAQIAVLMENGIPTLAHPSESETREAARELQNRSDKGAIAGPYYTVHVIPFTTNIATGESRS